MKKYCLIIILILPIIASQCVFEGQSIVTLKNNTDFGIVPLYADAMSGFSYPDTLLPDTPIFQGPSLISYVKAHPKDDIGHVYSEPNWKRTLSVYTTSDTLSVFIFHLDTLLNVPWKEIRDGYKILARYDLTVKDLYDLDDVIYYPPTVAMRNVKMFPPYEKIVGR